MKTLTKNSVFTFLFLFLSVSLFAQIPSDYWDGTDGLTGDALKQKLHDIISANVDYQSYTPGVWDAFYTTDVHPGTDQIWDMYGEPAYTYTVGDDQCGTAYGEGDCYNREHSFPKSWFGGSTSQGPGTDLHHIFPTDGYVNSRRSNYPYGDVADAYWTSQNGSKLGTCANSNYDGTVFEPRDEYKGDFARALFYMATMYKDELPQWVADYSADFDIDVVFQADGSFQPWYYDMMYQWHKDDPVSQKEIDRNNAIYNIQGNANPYISHPEWVAMVFGGATADDNTGDNTTTTDGCVADLIISEYGEGSSYNKYIEIYNGTGSDVDLSNYRLSLVYNGGSWNEGTISLSDVTLADGEVYVVANPSASSDILNKADQTSGTLSFNGDDGVALQKNINGTWTNIDVIGTTTDPGTGWSVAGVSNATYDHTLVRKSDVTEPTTDWATSAGTTEDNSQWIVYAKDDISDLGTHTVSCSSSGTSTTTLTATDLFISEYGEGSSYNKYIEIFNGTGSDVDLSNYRLSLVYNGGSWNEGTISLNDVTLANGEVYVVANSSASSTVTNEADQTSGTLSFNGDDGVALQKYVNGTWVNIDVIGTTTDPGTGWSVAGVSNATYNHTLVRKSDVTEPTTDWATSAGTTADNSQWIVYDEDYFDNLGTHTFGSTTQSAAATSPEEQITIEKSQSVQEEPAKVYVYKVFPNPSTGVFYVAVPPTENNVKLSVFDASGRMIISENNVVNGQKINRYFVLLKRTVLYQNF